MTYRDPEPVNFAAAVLEGERLRRDAETEARRATDELSAALRKAGATLGLRSFGWRQFVPQAPGGKYGQNLWHEPLRAGLPFDLVLGGDAFGPDIDPQGGRWCVDGTPRWSVEAAVAAALATPQAARRIAQQRTRLEQLHDRALQHFERRALTRNIAGGAVCLEIGLYLLDAIAGPISGLVHPADGVVGLGELCAALITAVAVVCWLWVKYMGGADYISDDADAQRTVEEYRTSEAAATRMREATK